MTVRTRCRWVNFMECGASLYAARFHLMLKEADCGSYVRPAIVNGSYTL